MKVLIAPLDWGLGHSTRCITIIKRLIFHGCSVLIAAEGPSKKLLELEFPTLVFLPLQGYNIQYSKSKRILPIKILCQLPAIWNIVKKEHRWLNDVITKHNINLIISDNRFGLWHPLVTSIFITHQLQIKGPNKWIESLLLKFNYQHINRFTACWIPDFEGALNIAGTLSHPSIMPKVPVKYIGALSRLNSHYPDHLIYDLLIVISGPEPQRGIFEKILLKNLASYHGRVLLIRGLPGNKEEFEKLRNIEIRNHLNATDLEQAYSQSKLVISRAGYTTIMDIIKLKKKSILIPTPGQTEQEYLSKHLQNQQLTLTYQQDDFDLNIALKTAENFDYKFLELDMDLYKDAIDDLVHTCSYQLA